MGMMDRSMILTYLIRALVMLVAIPAHEAAHALVSWKLGDSTAKDCGRLTLNPIPHLDLWGTLCMIFVGVGWAKPVPADPSRFKNPKVGMAVSASAGPIANIIIAFLSVLFYKVIYYFAPETAAWGFVLELMACLASIDILLAVFNLLPVPPFDGSRIALAFLPQHLYFKIMRYERYIMMGMFVLLIIGLLDAPLYFLQEKLWQLLFWATSFVDKFFLMQFGVGV